MCFRILQKPSPFGIDADWHLPATHAQLPWFDFTKLALEWNLIGRLAGFQVLAETHDGQWIACADRHGIDVGDDSPVYEFSTETLFRLEDDILSAGPNARDLVFS